MIQLLNFESELDVLETKIKSLSQSEEENAEDILKKRKKLERQKNASLAKIYSNLSDWQICQVARHPARPQAIDYIHTLFSDFVELSGDRLYSDDPAIITGLARLNNHPIVIIGQQKGRDTTERINRNFGMAGPEGYRKSLRMMNLANKFNIPIMTFIDTPGAYPGIGAEERGQSSAIGHCLYRSFTLEVPILTIVIGEGGSGGALALAVGDYVGMLSYSIYSVISPEGAASILWKDASRTEDVAGILALTAPKLKKLHLIDEIIKEPVGGAHRQPQETYEAVKKALTEKLAHCKRMDKDKLLEARQKRWRNYGTYNEVRQ